MTKLVPPAKSVTLSNLQAYAIIKKINCMATVMIAHIARLLSSHRYTDCVKFAVQLLTSISSDLKKNKRYHYH